MKIIYYLFSFLKKKKNHVKKVDDNSDPYPKAEWNVRYPKKVDDWYKRKQELKEAKRDIREWIKSEN